MVSHHPTKSGGHRHSGSEDMFLVAGGQDSTCFRFNPPLLLSLKHVPCHAHTHETSGRRHNNQPLCPMKDSRSW